MARMKVEFRDYVIGIDPGTACGWALFRCNRRGYRYVASGSWDLSRRKHEGGGMQMYRLGKSLSNLIEGARERGAVQFFLSYEEVRFRGENAGIDASHMYGAVVGKITEVCETEHIPYMGTGPGTAKMTVLGNGNGNRSKQQVRKYLETLLKRSLNSADKTVVRKKTRKKEIEKEYDESDAVLLAMAFIYGNYLG